MKKSISKLQSLLLLLSGFLIIAGCNNFEKKDSKEKDPKTLTQISVRYPIPIIEAGQTPYYVAQDKGFYSEEGLEVKFEMGSKELNPVKMVVSGTDDFAILGGPDPMLVARSKGQLLQAIAIIHRNSNFPCLITLKTSGIKDVKQLNGKKVGFNYGHISTDVLRSLFHQENIKVEEIDVGMDYNQLINGKILAEWGFTVTAGLELPAKGIDINIINPSTYGFVTHGYTIFTTEKLIKENPDLVLRFLRASLKGVSFTVNNPEDALKSLLNRDPKLDPALNLTRIKAYNAVTSNSTEFPAGYMDKRMFQETYDRLVNEKIIETKFNLHDVYTTQFLEKIYSRRFE
jgi:NitT/TauT family transport system substrate-binding protein